MGLEAEGRGEGTEKKEEEEEEKEEEEEEEKEEKEEVEEEGKIPQNGTSHQITTHPTQPIHQDLSRP